MPCKQRAAEGINLFLEPIRERRAFFETRPLIIIEAVQKGNERVLREGQETIDLVRQAMHYNYNGLLGGDRIAAG